MKNHRRAEMLQQNEPDKSCGGREKRQQTFSMCSLRAREPKLREELSESATRKIPENEKVFCSMEESVSRVKFSSQQDVEQSGGCNKNFAI
jgi:hypothetical protein